MKKLLLPAILALTGLGGGLAAGVALRPEGAGDLPADEGNEPDAHDSAPEKTATDSAHGPSTGESEFVKLDNQFVVPVIENERVGSLVLLTLSLETPPGGKEAVVAREPKLRDALLQVLFDHANAGGFRETFTDTANMLALRRALREAAQSALGADKVRDVLIVDILRQDG